jgi:hypothetical protein
MDRKQFLRACTGGLCACATACLPAAAATEAAQPEDWRWGFLRKRYAKLIGMLSETMDEATLSKTLVKLGTFCSAEYDSMLDKYKGDVEGFAEHVRTTSSGDIITYDRANGVITMTTDERPDCFCPLNSVKAKTPAAVCNCSLGWQTHTWERILGKKVRVDLKEAVLRGGKRCTFEIHILEA